MRIIVNADDFGLNHNRNLAVDYAMRNGMCTQGSIILNTPFSDEAVRMAKEGGYFHKIGLHLNITYGKPLSNSIKQLSSYCSDGLYIGTEPRSLSKVYSLCGIKEIREELEMQITKFFDLGFSFRHIDAHNDILFNSAVWKAFIPLIKKYDIRHIRGVEPYLFGYYRKSIIAYLPIKYFFMYKFISLHDFGKCKILHGGRNVNQFYRDYGMLQRGEKTNRIIGNIYLKGVYEVITHPDFDGVQFLDRTNFNQNKVINTLFDTMNKIEGFERITYNEL